MAEPTTRIEFKAWCKRKLGYPVIDINVDDDQVDDRVDEAIQFWNEFMQNGQQRVYLKHKLTQEDINRAKTNTKETPTALGTGAANIGTTTLNAEAGSGTTILQLVDGTSFPTTGVVRVNSENITYTAKTTVSGNIVNLTVGSLSSTHPIASTITLHVTAEWGIGQDFIPMPDGILSVLRILPFTDRGNLNMFDIRYQLRLNDLYDFSDISVIHYQMTMWQLDLLDMILVGEKPINFSVISDRLYIDMAWSSDLDVGEYIIMECYRKLSPGDYTKAFNDFWLKRYATALIKRQWGENLIKFQGVTMLGGVSMNGETIYNEAIREIGELETEGRLVWEEPLMFDIG
ncbi:MAG TPA: hypothetical protein EYM50_03565 [Nitrososphaerales archaeon]|jgi:hypothetical protein|nr:hypothetical protein [Nitrososphaerales archaeon]